MKMKIVETKKIELELDVAPCLKCGDENIKFNDNNDTSFNTGGGTCSKCGNESYKAVGLDPKIEILVTIWNSGNDVKTLIQNEKNKIEEAKKRIAELKPKLTLDDLLQPLSNLDKECLMTAEEYIEGEESCCFTSDDGSGYWATKDKISHFSIYTSRPNWATHVVWYNK